MFHEDFTFTSRETENIFKTGFIPASFDEQFENRAVRELATAHFKLLCKGTEQYISWNQFREIFDGALTEVEVKKMCVLGENLSAIRERVDELLTHKWGDCGNSVRVSEDHAVAVVVKLLDLVCLRVGNTSKNNTYGLTTLLKKHVKDKGSHIELEFPGKKGVLNHAKILQPTLLRALRSFSRTSKNGGPLFSFNSVNGRRGVSSRDVNGFLNRWGVTAKDLRTWGANYVFVKCICNLSKKTIESEREVKKILNSAIRSVAEFLNNTPRVVKNSYVSQKLYDRYKENPKEFMRRIKRLYKQHPDPIKIFLIQSFNGNN